MRAAVVTEPGGPEVLQVAEIEDPVPGPDEVLVAVHASALNRADLMQRRGGYPAPPGIRPDVPGLELAGVVEATGERVQNWTPGDRVMALMGGGGYASKAIAHERQLMAIPEGLSFEQAAAIPEVYLTAFDALFVHCDGHYTAEGNGIVASVLADWIEGRGWLAARAAPGRRGRS